MMKQAAIVEQADAGEQCGAGENSDDLLVRYAAQGEQNGEHESEVDRDAAKQWNRIEMDFARAGTVHHTVVQREAAHRDGEQESADERDGKTDQSGGKGHRVTSRPVMEHQRQSRGD